MDSLPDADAIYLNGPRTVAHAQLLKSRGAFNLRIDEEFMAKLKPGCVILDPDAAKRRLRRPRERPSTGKLPAGGELPCSSAWPSSAPCLGRGIPATGNLAGR